MIDRSPIEWRKADRSGSGDNCVELAAVLGGVAIRDSKNPAGGLIMLSEEGFADLVVRVKRGEFAG